MSIDVSAHRPNGATEEISHVCEWDLASHPDNVIDLLPG